MSAKKYIVVFKDGVSEEEVKKYAEKVDKSGGKVTNQYDSGVLNGFAAEIPDNFVQELQSLDGIISYIEPDGVVTTQ